MEALILLALLLVVGAPIALGAALVSARSRLAAIERRLGDDARRLLRLENQVREIKEAPRARERRETQPTPAIAPTQERPETVRPIPAPERLPQQSVPPASPEPPHRPVGRPASAFSPRSTPAGASSAIDDWFSAAKGWLLGGNTLVRVGMVVVLFGVAFFLKFAFDQGWVPIEIRLMAAAAGGLGLTGLGWGLRESRPEYSRVIQGGGIGIVYLTVFASTNFYDLIPPGAAMPLMVVLVALASAMAVLQNARGLAVAATAGGFLAPVLVSSGGSHVVLFAYYLVLDLGVVGIALFRAWRVLNLVGFAFTFGIGSAWGARYYQPEFFRTTEPFLVAFFLLYVAVPVLFASRVMGPEDSSGRPGKGLVDGSLVFGTPLVAFGLQSLLVAEFEYGRALSAMGVAILYATLATWLWNRRLPRFGFLAEVFVSLGVAFGTLTIPLALDARWTGAAWALEGAGLVWVGIRQRQSLAWLAGLCMQVAAASAYFVALALSATPEVPVANGIFLGAVLIALAGFSSAWHLRPIGKAFSAGALAWGLAWWFGAGFNEIATFLSQIDRLHGYLLFTTASLAATAVLRSRLAWPQLAFPLIGLLPAMALSAIDLFTTEAHPFGPRGLVVWVAAFSAQLWTLARVDSSGDWPLPLRSAWHIGTLWLGVFLTSWEASWVMGEVSGPRPTWQTVAWIVLPVATIAGIGKLLGRAQDGPDLAWPLSEHPDGYRSALDVLAVLTAFWIVGVSFRTGDPTPLPYVPVVNPLVLAQIVSLIVVARWARSAMGRASLLGDVLSLARLGPVIGLVAFIILNGVIARATHMYGGVPFRLEALWESAGYQTVASIAWTLAALIVMVTATRWQRRAVWGSGAVLLGLVVVKLFLVDLAGIGTIARIVSFLVVGMLILLIGYLSPLPPRVMERTS